MILVILAGASRLAAAQVRHVPPADAEAGQDLRLVAEAGASTPTLVAHVRQRGTQPFSTIELVRNADASWVAVIPAATVAVPGLDYYITAGDAAVFASPEWPHTVEVHATPNAERRGRDELRSHNRRSRIHAMGEYVTYGRRTYGPAEIDDHYYRLDLDFAYRLWTYPLEEVRVGYTRLLGTTGNASCNFDLPNCMEENAGFKVGGWFELGLAAVEGIRLDARMIVTADQEGFGAGGRGEARLGDRDASHIALGVEYLGPVGTNGFFRLGWGTVPKVPMSATVEITNLPASHRDTGVRLYYDVATEVAPGVRIGVRVGYAARVQSVAGVSGGAGATVEF
jgi:hypothetical protein